MKRIKTRLRNRLKDDNLEWLMLASVEGPDWTDKDVTELTDEQAENIVRMCCHSGSPHPDVSPRMHR
eukprot:gene17981-biopygen3468